MKYCIEILQETSLAAMGSKLDSVYKDDLGIHKVSLGEGAADKTESLGRFLYRCLCAWLNKPSQLVNYHMTLFKGFTSEQAADEAPKSTNAYKKLN